MKSDLQVGIYKKEHDQMLGTNFEGIPIVCSEGLKSHIIKRKHFDVVECFDCLGEILKNPDYIGCGENQAVIFVKKINKNVTTVIKLNKDNDYFYVATMYSISDYKLERKLICGLLKEVDNSGI